MSIFVSKRGGSTASNSRLQTTPVFSSTITPARLRHDHADFGAVGCSVRSPGTTLTERQISQAPEIDIIACLCAAMVRPRTMKSYWWLTSCCAIRHEPAARGELGPRRCYDVRFGWRPSDALAVPPRASVSSAGQLARTALSSFVT